MSDQTLTPEQEEEMKKQLDAMMPKPTYHNAPADMDAAIQRILELELRLGDLHRAAEIGIVVKDFNLIEAMMGEAEACLEKKIEVEYPQGAPNIVVYSGEIDPDKLNAKA